MVKVLRHNSGTKMSFKGGAHYKFCYLVCDFFSECLVKNINMLKSFMYVDYRHKNIWTDSGGYLIIPTDIQTDGYTP